MSELQWQFLYEAAVLETDRAKLPARLDAAEGAIQKRYESGPLDKRELTEIEDAMRILRRLRQQEQV